MPSGKPKIMCGFEGCQYKHYDPRQMGRHRSREHGIPGKAAKTKGIIKHAPQQTSNEGVILDNGIKIELIAYATGNLEGFLRNLAEQHGIPTKLFSRRCAEYLLHASNG